MKKIFVITILISVIIPLSSRAVSIENDVTVSSNTGGNTAGAGEVIEGEGKTEVYIENIVNGESIKPVDIETEGNEVSVEQEITAEDGVAEVEREITIDSETTAEEYKVDLDNSVAGAEDSQKDKLTQEEQGGIEQEGVFNDIKNWIITFVENVKTFFENLFT